MITVACVYWKGSFRGRQKVYDESWVIKLQNMVSRNLKEPHRFVCLSNVEAISGVEIIPLKHDWPGWWSKIELFRPGLFEGRVMYLDLDVLIVKDLDPIVNYASPFVIIGKNKKKAYPKDGKMIVDRYNSSVMVWDVGEISEYIYTSFYPEIIGTFRGDQDYIGYRSPVIDEFPSSWIKKLRFLPNQEPDENVKIILCMLGKAGKNNAAVVIHDWVKSVWI